MCDFDAQQVGTLYQHSSPPRPLVLDIDSFGISSYFYIYRRGENLIWIHFAHNYTTVNMVTFVDI